MQFSSFILSALVLLTGWAGTAYPPEIPEDSDQAYKSVREGEAVVWARQVLDTLTLDEKLGQLFMIPAYSNKGEEHVIKILQLVMEEKVGGVILMQGGPLAQTHLANLLQNNSDLPLMVSQDAEWGPAMRLDSVMKFPKNMTLGAIQDEEVVYRLGKEIARQCKATGVQVNFSPVVDINNNSNNPVINDRSFGEDRNNVTRKSIAMMKGLQDGGVMACAKHFPGHGDTQTDSHLDLPVIPHGKERMDSLELYPFREMIREGVQSVMVAHLFLPQYEPRPNRPSTVSKALTDSLLRKEMNFKGLIFTDALNMKGISKYYSNGDAELQALLAGNDILLFSESVAAGKLKIKAALDSGLISVQEIDQKVLRILAAKYELGLQENRTTDPRYTLTALNQASAKSLKSEIYRKALTLVSDPKAQMPLSTTSGIKLAFVQCGGKTSAPFLNYLKQYAPITPISLSQTELESMTKEKASQLFKGYDQVVVAWMGLERNPTKNFGVKAYHTQLVEALQKADIPRVICVFGNPYALKNLDPQQAILLAYEEDAEAQSACAEGLFAVNTIEGKLPVTAGPFPALTGLTIGKSAYETASPQEVGMSPDIYRKVDSVVQSAIRLGAMPGCAILVQHKGKVVLARGYGSYRYDTNEPVNPAFTRYDLASVTKVAATTLSIMKLYELGKIHPDSVLETYLSETKATDKGKLTLRSLLLHQSGLPAWLPTQQASLLAGKVWKPWVFSSVASEHFPLKVGPSIYQTRDWQDSVWNMILSAKVSTDKKYLYSDVGMILLGKVIERTSGMTLDSFAKAYFYAPLGLHQTGFCPWKSENGTSICPPTEQDKVWRKGEVQGTVHDQTSAMLGGVAGHAGLFSSATDLGLLMGMLCQGGRDSILRKETIQLFTGRQPNSRRGLGWDKPAPKGQSSPCSDYCSPSTFGHTGFTGTCVWVDPDKEIVYIFLSNRTWPNAENKKLIQESIRTKIQDIIYNCVISG